MLVCICELGWATVPTCLLKQGALGVAVQVFEDEINIQARRHGVKPIMLQNVGGPHPIP